MKKEYVSPEFELLKLDLSCDVLSGSYEIGQSEEATGNMDDLFGDF